MPAACLVLFTELIAARLRGQRGQAGFLATVLLLLFICSWLSWAIGWMVKEHHKRATQLYVAHAAELLNAAKEQTGRYPDCLSEAQFGKLPKLLNFSSHHDGGERFVFYYNDPASPMKMYVFDSDSRKWFVDAD